MRTAEVTHIYDGRVVGVFETPVLWLETGWRAYSVLEPEAWARAEGQDT